MKKPYTALATILVLVLFCGCAGGRTRDTAQPAGGDGVTIAASFYPMYIIALNVAGGIPGVQAVCMTPPMAGCLHDYAATADDMKRLEGADILIVNGAGAESFLDKVIRQLPGIQLIEASEGIPFIKDGNGSDNPHVWVSVTNCIRQVRNIQARLCELDAAHASQYKANADAYAGKLEALRDKMHNALAGVAHRDIITFHEAFPYFAQEFNLNIAGVVEREPGSEPSAKELADTVELVKKLKINALFAEPQYSASAADTIARETGARVYTLDPAVYGPDDPDAYLGIMESNLLVLLEALK